MYAICILADKNMGQVTQLECGSDGKALLNGKSVTEVIQMEEHSILLGESNEEEAAVLKKKKEEEARALIKEADKERELMAQFDEIRKLCGGETDFNKSPVFDAALKKLASFTQSLCNGNGSTSTDMVNIFYPKYYRGCKISVLGGLRMWKRINLRRSA